jgi:hypothetical protein
MPTTRRSLLICAVLLAAPSAIGIRTSPVGMAVHLLMLLCGLYLAVLAMRRRA